MDYLDCIPRMYQAEKIRRVKEIKVKIKLDHLGKERRKDRYDISVFIIVVII